MGNCKMKTITYRIFLIILALSMISSFTLRKEMVKFEMDNFQRENATEKVDANKMFENELALDDKYDPNLRTPKNRGYDLNNVSKTTEKDLDNKLMDDLQSEHVNYRFD